MKFSQIENWRFWKMTFFWVSHFEFFFEKIFFCFILMKICHKLCVRMDGTQILWLWWFTAKNQSPQRFQPAVYKASKTKKLALNSQLQTVQILKNDVQMLILSLSYLATTVRCIFPCIDPKLFGGLVIITKCCGIKCQKSLENLTTAAKVHKLCSQQEVGR